LFFSFLPVCGAAVFRLFQSRASAAALALALEASKTAAEEAEQRLAEEAEAENEKKAQGQWLLQRCGGPSRLVQVGRKLGESSPVHSSTVVLKF